MKNIPTFYRVETYRKILGKIYKNSYKHQRFPGSKIKTKNKVAVDRRSSVIGLRDVVCNTKALNGLEP